jgi:hypothetical protein
MDDIIAEKPFDDDECDALSLLQYDVSDARADAEASTKALAAVETIVAVFEQATKRQVRLRDAEGVIAHLRRLAQIMEDYYAANP